MTQTGHVASPLPLLPVRLWAALVAHLAALWAWLYHRAGAVLLSPYAPRQFLDALLSMALLALAASVLAGSFVWSVQ